MTKREAQLTSVDIQADGQGILSGSGGNLRMCSASYNCQDVLT